MARRGACGSTLSSLLFVTAVSGGCSQFVQYTDEISNSRTGRTAFVTTPTTLGGSVGFLVGLPADLALLPLTYPFYLYQKSRDPLVAADPISTLLFPSFVCWRAGKLLGAPFDLVEFVAYRAWRDEQTMSRAEREAIEVGHDEQALPTYPVEPIYPTEEWLEKALSDGGN